MARALKSSFKRFPRIGRECHTFDQVEPVEKKAEESRIVVHQKEVAVVNGTDAPKSTNAISTWTLGKREESPLVGLKWDMPAESCASQNLLKRRKVP